MTQALGSDAAKFMAEKDYTLIAKTVNSVIFRDAHRAPQASRGRQITRT